MILVKLIMGYLFYCCKDSQQSYSLMPGWHGYKFLLLVLLTAAL